MTPVLNLETVVVRFVGDTKAFDASVANIERRLQYTATRFATYGAGLINSIGLPIAILTGIWMRQFARLDDVINRSLTNIGSFQTKVETQRAKAAAMGEIFGIARGTRVSPMEIASAFEVLSRNGMSAAEALRTVDRVQKFAVATNSELVKSVETLAGVQESLGLRSNDAAKNLENLTHITEVFAMASTMARTPAEKLAEGLDRNVGAALRGTHRSLEEGAAALTVFAMQNVKGAAAGQQLRFMLRGLEDASTKGVDSWRKLGYGIHQVSGQLNSHSTISSKVAGAHTQLHNSMAAGGRATQGYSNAWGRLGLSFYDASGKALPLWKIIQQIEKATEGASDKQAKTMEILAGINTRVARGLYLLVGYSDTLRMLTEKYGSANVVQEMFDKNMLSVTAQTQLLTNAVQELGISIMSIVAPELYRLINLVREWIVSFTRLDPEIQKIVVRVIAATVALRGLMAVVNVGRSVIMFFLTPLMSAFGMIVGIFSGMGLWLIPLVAALAGLAAVMGKEGLTAMWDKMKTGLSSFWEFAKGFMVNFSENWKILMDWIPDHWDEMLNYLIEASSKFSFNLATNLVVGLQAAVSLMINFLILNLDRILHNVLALLMNIGLQVSGRINAFIRATLEESGKEIRNWIRDLSNSLPFGFQRFVFGTMGMTSRKERIRDSSEILEDISKMTVRSPMRFKDFRPVPAGETAAILEMYRKELVSLGKGIGAPKFGMPQFKMPQTELQKRMMDMGIAMAGGMPSSGLEHILERAVRNGVGGLQKSLDDMPSHLAPNPASIVGLDFKSLNLKQFVLEGPGGLTRGIINPRTMETSDNQTHQELKQLRGSIDALMGTLSVGD